MIRYSDEDRNAYILSLAELRCRLAAMNGPDIQWEVLCLRVVEEAGEPRTYVVIRHLDVDNAPNEPHFLFPAASAGGDIQDERQTLVLLDPSMATPQNEGRYWDRDCLKRDCLEDFRRFWEPIRKTFDAIIGA